MTCAASNNPNMICVSFDGTTWTFTPDELHFDDSHPGRNPILIQRDQDDSWTFESFSWKDHPPAGVFGTPVVTGRTITITDNNSVAGSWRYQVCVMLDDTEHCCDPRIVNM